jgi:hypothetical protein
MPSDFAQKFCAHFEAAPGRYRSIALARALYPHARLLRPLLECFDSEFFAADREFVNEIGRLTRRRDFGVVADEFHKDSDNFRFLRRKLRLRVSTARMKSMFLEVWEKERPAVATEPCGHAS